MMPVVESLPALVVVLLLLDKMYYSWCFAGEDVVNVFNNEEEHKKRSKGGLLFFF